MLAFGSILVVLLLRYFLLSPHRHMRPPVKPGAGTKEGGGGAPFWAAARGVVRFGGVGATTVSGGVVLGGHGGCGGVTVASTCPGLRWIWMVRPAGGVSSGSWWCGRPLLAGSTPAARGGRRARLRQPDSQVSVWSYGWAANGLEGGPVWSDLARGGLLPWHALRAAGPRCGTSCRR